MTGRQCFKIAAGGLCALGVLANGGLMAGALVDGSANDAAAYLLVAANAAAFGVFAVFGTGRG